MFSESAELYDLIYGSFKDYRSEAATIAGLIRDRAPHATDVLDVACGTGEHARFLIEEHSLLVSGIDLEPAFVAQATAKVPAGEFYEADMASFSLDRTYDVVMCLFSSIGYVRDIPRLTETFKRFREHLSPGGIVLIEPWFAPGQWQHGRVFVHTSDSDGYHIVRMSHSAVDGHVSKLRFHYLVGGAEGVEHRTEDHELGLFTQREMQDAFTAAGFVDVTYDPVGLTDRGLYTAR